MKPRPYLLRREYFGKGTDHGYTEHRFGYIGDSHSGTLKCNWCDREFFVHEHEVDDVCKQHWEWHFKLLDRIVAEWTAEREADNEAYEWWKSQQL
jgi:hypothetical protein